ncbi:MAG: winged helix-turn-helix domain-containing protein [Woeseiaceae bacterium]|nr:winged helix-turn-helix domain-containing protein [Woeseiaceae bacterium]
MNSFQFGSFVLEGRLQRLLHDGQIVPLKPKAYDLLCKLLAEPDRVVSKDELLDYLWPRQDVGEANLTQTIYELRQALGETARDASWIETVPRRGYRFKGGVSVLTDSLPTAAHKSIAVLPFRALTSQPEMQDLGLGITDAVILSLSSAGRLVVRSLSAVLPYVDTAEDSAAIGQRLEVDTVLEGTVQKYGDQVRMNARLLACSDRADLWTGKLETSTQDLFAIQDQIAQQAANAVTESLGDQVSAPRHESHGSHSDAHPLYLKARYCWQRWVPEALRQALQYLDEAIALDPSHAPSHAWRSAAWSTLGILGEVTPTDAANEARQSAQRAIELDGQYSQGHEMLGAVQLFFDWDLSAAAQSFDAAIDLDPTSANARHLRAISLALGGHDQAALAEMERALREDPSSVIANCDMGMVHYWGRRFDEARRWYELTLEQDPGFAHARSGLAFALLELGEEDAAVREIQRASENRGRIAAGELAYVLGRAGQASEASALLDQLSSSEKVDPYQQVLAHLGMKDYEKTFEWLDRALEHRSRDLVLLGVSPIVDPIRGSDRFRAFMQRAALPKVADAS